MSVCTQVAEGKDLLGCSGGPAWLFDIADVLPFGARYLAIAYLFRTRVIVARVNRLENGQLVR